MEMIFSLDYWLLTKIKKKGFRKESIYEVRNDKFIFRSVDFHEAGCKQVVIIKKDFNILLHMLLWEYQDRPGKVCIWVCGDMAVLY